MNPGLAVSLYVVILAALAVLVRWEYMRGRSRDRSRGRAQTRPRDLSLALREPSANQPTGHDWPLANAKWDRIYGSSK